MPEEELSDLEYNIEGTLDLLIISDGMPIEIRDYKTGNIYDLEAKKALDDEKTDCEDEHIKEDFRKQLFLYALLVKKKYGHYPEKLTIVTNDGEFHLLN